MERRIGDPRHFLISDGHKGVIVDADKKPKKNQMLHLKPKKKKRK